jgi:hypothetical protein
MAGKVISFRSSERYQSLLPPLWVCIACRRVRNCPGPCGAKTRDDLPRAERVVRPHEVLAERWTKQGGRSGGKVIPFRPKRARRIKRRRAPEALAERWLELAEEVEAMARKGPRRKPVPPAEPNGGKED